MSGHSKWSTIKRKKGAEDARRGRIFTRLARDISIAAREGSGDPDANPSLRLAVDRAKAANMPKENIERAIMRGTGELKGGELEEVTYEGYGPHGVALLVKCLTDNRNRTISEVRRVLHRANGNMAEAGAVSWMFENRGYIPISLEEGGDPDEVFMLAVDAGAEDVDTEDDFVEVYTSAQDLHRVREALKEHGFDVDDAEISAIPKTTISLGEKEAMQVLNLVEALEELDDVQQVYSNLEISDELMAQLA